MTFKLKGYNELKAHFAETVEIIVKKYKVESIEELIEPRRSQVKFINYIIESLDTRLESTNHTQVAKVLDEASRILNGAMLLVGTQVTESLGTIQRNSLLRDRLHLGIGIKEDAIPTPFDLNECHKELNKFLKLVFVDRNSRKGLKAEHDLQYVDLDALVSLMKRNYELEELTHKNMIAEYPMGGKLAIVARNFKTDPFPKSLVEPFTNWATLQEALQQLETDELADKNVADISLLSKERAAQFNFLKALVHSLNTQFPETGKDNVKTAILAGAMCIVREQIGQREYSKAALSHSDITSSIIHTGLSTILKSKENSPENIEALLRVANDYIMFMTTEPKKFKDKHILSEIKSFALPDILELIQSTIKSCRTTALDRVVTAHKLILAEKAEAERIAKAKEETEVVAPTSGVMGLLGTIGTTLFGSSKPKAVEKAKVDVVDEHAVVNAGPQ